VPRTPNWVPDDPYEVLQVSPRASSDVIRAAYRVLARNYHPDVSTSPTSAVRMRELNAAYKALIDPQLRAQLDAQKPVARARDAASHRLKAAAPRRVHVARTQAPVPRSRLARPTVLALALGIFLMVVLALVVAISFAIDALDAPVSADQILQAASFATLA